MKMIPYMLREHTESDRNFILNSFLQSFREHSNHSYIPKSIYYKNQAEIIEFLLSTANCLVVCFPEAPEEIMGYIIYEQVVGNLVVHFAYIKTTYRTHHIMNEIIDSIIPSSTSNIIATHIPYYFRYLKEKSKYSMVYDPYYITNKRLLHNRT